MSTAPHLVALSESRAAGLPYDSRAVGRALLLPLLAMALAWTWHFHFWPTLHTANEAIRLYFVQAVVEDGVPELDRVTRRHRSVPVDRAEKDGHLYMDKAPGLSILALPVYPAVRAVWPNLDGRRLWRLGWLTCLAVVTVPLLVALRAFLRHLTATGVAPRDAVLATLALGLASPVFVYATLLFGHGLATACVALGVLHLAGRDPAAASRARGLVAGLLFGYAGLTDTPLFVFGALACIWVAVRAALLADGTLPPWRGRLLAGWRASLPVAVGLAVGVAAQLGFNAWMLGHPLNFAYEFKGDANLAAIMAQGVLGFRPPQLDALWGLWLGSKRGLLYHAPWLVFAVIGHVGVAMRRDLPARLRVDAAGLLAMSLAYALFVAGFADWPAGDSAGPRHLLPIVPLLAVGLGGLLTHGRLPPSARAAVLATVALGVLLHVPTVATFPYHFDNLQMPVLDLGWPLAVTGFFSPSLGRLLGWSDWLSAATFACLVLLPWLLLLRLPPAPPPPESPPARSGMVLAMAAGLTVAWLTVLVSGTSYPGRTVELARFRAQTMLGASADERDGNKEWQAMMREAQQNRP